MSKYSVLDRSGGRIEIDVEIEDYRAAAEAGLSLTQHLANKYPSVDHAHGTVMEQCMQSAGLFVRPDKETGLRPPTMKQVLDGNLQFNAAGAITRNDGSNNQTTTGRMLFPEIVMQMIAHELTVNNEDVLGGYNEMVATTEFVTGPKFEQPIINVTAPEGEGSANRPIAQLSEPSSMVSITLAESTRRIPTKSVGLTFSDEALAATTLDLVGIIMAAQARGERTRMIEGQMASMINGDADIGETALSAVTAQSFDSSISAAGSITHLAWVKYLRSRYQQMTITDIITDVETALLIESRTGKPTVQSDDPNSPRIDALFSLKNLNLPSPKILLVPTATLGANTLVGLDRRFAIRRVVNVAAAYSAIEQYVMRRATSLRVDYGEISHKLFPTAWHKMTLTV